MGGVGNDRISLSISLAPDAVLATLESSLTAGRLWEPVSKLLPLSLASEVFKFPVCGACSECDIDSLWLGTSVAEGPAKHLFCSKNMSLQAKVNLIFQKEGIFEYGKRLRYSIYHVIEKIARVF